MKLTRNYANADEKFVKTVTVYAKKSDNFIYADAACTQKIDKDTMTRTSPAYRRRRASRRP